MLVFTRLLTQNHLDISEISSALSYSAYSNSTDRLGAILKNLGSQHACTIICISVINFKFRKLPIRNIDFSLENDF